MRESEIVFRALSLKAQCARASGEDGDHPDRIGALWFLSGCLEKQRRVQEALQICQHLVMALQEIGGMGSKHRFAFRLQRKIDELNGKAKGSAQGGGACLSLSKAPRSQG